MLVKNLDVMLDELGITREMQLACRLPRFIEDPALIDAGLDMFDRPQQMTAETLTAWQAMQAAALTDGITLKLVSAYRSVEYQCGLIRRKLDAGQNIDDILCVNAIPGYSEHHTGRALDLHAGEGEPLTESFEEEDAFHWLIENASAFRFYLSYPRDNTEGIVYEPWHWCFHPDNR